MTKTDQIAQYPENYVEASVVLVQAMGVAMDYAEENRDPLSVQRAEAVVRSVLEFIGHRDALKHGFKAVIGRG